MSQVHALNRRRFLSGAASLAGAATLAATTTALAGCGSSGGGTRSAGHAQLPTYQRIEGQVEPDLTGDGTVEDVYFSYPNPQFTSVEHATGSGGELRGMLITYAAPPTPLGQNTYWQLMNEKLGVTFTPDLVPEADFLQKFSTVVAGGGDLPDIIQAPWWMKLPRLDQLIENQFTDLTEHLSGDAVLKYPNLANIATASWKNAIASGIIWGVPVPRSLFPVVLTVNIKRSEQAGFAEPPKTQEEFLEWGKAMTNKSKQQYAFSGAIGRWMEQTVDGMYELPNEWQLDGETLTEPYDHPAYFDALDFTKSLWDLGYFHPDNPGMTGAQQKTLFWNGTVAATENGFGGLGAARQTPDVPITGRAPWTLDGSKVHAKQNPGIFSITALKKNSDKAKIEEYLNIIDYLAAPFGSKEYTDINFGVDGEHYDMKDGSPTPNPDKADDKNISIGYVGAAPGTLYGPDEVMRETYTRFHAIQQDYATGLVPNPCLALRSETLNRNGQYITTIEDARVDYILGRKPLGEVQAAIKKYQDEIGAQVKEEYLTALKDRGDI